MLGDYHFQNPGAERLTILRIQARRKRRLTYDCMNATVKPGSDGEMVACQEGHRFLKLGLQKEEGFPLFSVLKGRSSSVCQDCRDFDRETTE